MKPSSWLCALVTAALASSTAWALPKRLPVRPDGKLPNVTVQPVFRDAAGRPWRAQYGTARLEHTPPGSLRLNGSGSIGPSNGVTTPLNLTPRTP